MAFGKSQLQNPTPAGVARLLDIFCAISGVVIGYVTTAPYIANTTSNIIAGLLGLFVGIAQVLKPFFGVTSAPSKVDLKNVVEMETPDK